MIQPGDGSIVMQLTVVSTENGLEIATQFADGYDEEDMLGAVEAWASEAVSKEPKSPGWGRP